MGVLDGHRRPVAVGRRRVAALGLGAVLAQATTWVGAAPAAAHVELEAAVPAGGQLLTVPPDAVSLRFSDPLQRSFSQVAVTGPDGTAVAAGPPIPSGSEVRQPVRATMPGGYVVAYRVLSRDGHPITGTLRFRYEPPASAAPGSPAAAAAPPTAADR